MESKDKIQAPPYFSFKTLTNMLTQMEEHGPPNRIDRSFLTGMSGAGQTQFMGGLRSLGLIDVEGNVQPYLTTLVSNPDDRPRLIGQLVRKRYPEAVALGAEGNATTGELQELFRSVHGVQGDTARKAIAFFLAAAKYAGDIRLSPNFKTPSVPRNGSSSPRRRRSTSQIEEQPEGGNGGGGNGMPPPSDLHPALATLVQALPAATMNGGSKPPFPADERKAWFAYARATFNLIYAPLAPGEADGAEEGT